MTPDTDDMTETQALAEARRRWGADATVAVDLTTCFEFHLVGEKRPDHAEPEWHGVGRTWSRAFEEADLRAAKAAG